MSTKAAKTATETMTEVFAPATEAFKTLQSKMEVPEAAREFVKKALIPLRRPLPTFTRMSRS